jgi:hypothetical protein
MAIGGSTLVDLRTTDHEVVGSNPGEISGKKGTTTFSTTTISIMALNAYAECHYVECLLCLVSFMMIVTIKSILLSVFYAECLLC